MFIMAYKFCSSFLHPHNSLRSSVPEIQPCGTPFCSWKMPAFSCLRILHLLYLLPGMLPLTSFLDGQIPLVLQDSVLGYLEYSIAQNLCSLLYGCHASVKDKIQIEPPLVVHHHIAIFLSFLTMTTV